MIRLGDTDVKKYVYIFSYFVMEGREGVRDDRLLGVVGSRAIVEFTKSVQGNMGWGGVLVPKTRCWILFDLKWHRSLYTTL